MQPKLPSYMYMVHLIRGHKLPMVSIIDGFEWSFMVIDGHRWSSMVIDGRWSMVDGRWSMVIESSMVSTSLFLGTMAWNTCDSSLTMHTKPFFLLFNRLINLRDWQRFCLMVHCSGTETYRHSFSSLRKAFAPKTIQSIVRSLLWFEVYPAGVGYYILKRLRSD